MGLLVYKKGHLLRCWFSSMTENTGFLHSIKKAMTASGAQCFPDAGKGRRNIYPNDGNQRLSFGLIRGRPPTPGVFADYKKGAGICAMRNPG
jgi:hypothetical protein